MRAFLVIAAPLALLASNAWSHDTTLSCDTATAKQPALEASRAELRQKPKSVGVRTNLSDKLIDAGCIEEAVHVLEDGVQLSPADRNLQTRLRNARSFISERDYLNKQSADDASDKSNSAEASRLQLRCKQLGDLASCEQALAGKPNDASLWTTKGDLLLKDKRAKDALIAFSRAKQLNASDTDLAARINAAQMLIATQSPPSIAGTPRTAQATPRVAVAPPISRTFSNIEPAGRSN